MTTPSRNERDWQSWIGQEQRLDTTEAKSTMEGRPMRSKKESDSAHEFSAKSFIWLAGRRRRPCFSHPTTALHVLLLFTHVPLPTPTPAVTEPICKHSCGNYTEPRFSEWCAVTFAPAFWLKGERARRGRGLFVEVFSEQKQRGRIRRDGILIASREGFCLFLSRREFRDNVSMI